MAQGLTEYGAAQALEDAIPSASNSYVGLFTTLPSARDGTGGVEASVGGYARKAHSSWVTVQEATGTFRKNSGAVTLDALTADLNDVSGWGIWDDPSAGNLVAFGPLVDSGDVVITQDYNSTDQPSFADQTLRVGIKSGD